MSPGLRHPFTWLLLAALPALAVLWALLAGQYPVSVAEVWRVLAAQVHGETSGLAAATEAVIWNLRLPRIAAALVIGATLGAAGAAYQNMFRNPLVSPDILGVSAGAGLGAAFAIFLGGSLLVVQASAFTGGLIAVGLVWLLSGLVRRHDPVLVLVLAGVAVGAFLGAGISLLKIFADPYTQLPSITFWLLGGLNTVNGPDLLASLPAMLLGLAPLVLLRWRINLLSLSDEEAGALGVNVTRLRAVLIAAATLASAAAVSIAGIIGWVGLVVPHMARLLVGAEFSRLLPASLLLGAGFLVVTDTLARTATAMELPLGVLTALVGAPVFLFLLARSGSRT